MNVVPLSLRRKIALELWRQKKITERVSINSKR